VTDRKAIAEHAQALVERTGLDRKIAAEATQVLVEATSVTRRTNAVHTQVLRPILATGSANAVFIQVLVQACRPVRCADGTPLQIKRGGVFERVHYLPGH
jgi:hypothetical protein